VEKPRKIARKPFAPPAIPEPWSLNDDYEALPPGSLARGAQSHEEGAATLRVSDEQAAGGKQSLKFSDAPGLKAQYNPHLVYTPGYRTGTATARFAIRLGTRAVFFHEWRDSQSPYQVGPSLWFRDGHLNVGGTTLMELPVEQWIEVEVTSKLGRAADGTYSLSVTLPDAEPKTFENLPFASPEFRHLDWLGFVSSATEAVNVYVDDVAVMVE
jgi:hypothetical protein